MPSSTIASRPAVTCSPEATTASYSTASCSGAVGIVFDRVMQRRGVARPGDQLVGLPGHGRDHDGDLVAGIDLALHVARHIADAVDVGDGGAAEFHHETGHEE